MFFMFVGHELILNGWLVDVVSFYLLSESIEVILQPVLFDYLLKNMFFILIFLLVKTTEISIVLLGKPKRWKLFYRVIDYFKHLIVR